MLTILALLAVAVIPPMIRRIDRAAWEKEKADLQAMADSYTRYILRTKSITNSSGLATAIAQEMGLSLSAINTTPRGWDRAFLVDPNFNIGGGNSYIQSSGGTGRPSKARVMLLSSIAGGLPVGSGDNNPDFQAIWDTPVGAKPSSSTWNSWQGKGEDLLVRKLNLEPLFYELLLTDPDNAGIKYSIDSTNSILSSVGPIDSYYLDGTVLGLYDCATNLQTRYLLQRNISFVFESCAWRGEIQGAGVRSNTNSTSSSASNFVSSATAFYASSWNQAAQSGASQTSVLVAMYTFMFDYVFWAAECPHFDYHGYTGSSLSTLPEYKMLNDMGQSCNGCKGIDSFSGPNGLLK